MKGTMSEILNSLAILDQMGMEMMPCIKRALKSGRLNGVLKCLEGDIWDAETRTIKDKERFEMTFTAIYESAWGTLNGHPELAKAWEQKFEKRWKHLV